MTPTYREFEMSHLTSTKNKFVSWSDRWMFSCEKILPDKIKVLSYDRKPRSTFYLNVLAFRERLLLFNYLNLIITECRC